MKAVCVPVRSYRCCRRLLDPVVCVEEGSKSRTEPRYSRYARGWRNPAPEASVSSSGEYC